MYITNYIQMKCVCAEKNDSYLIEILFLVHLASSSKLDHVWLVSKMQDFALK